MEHLNIFNDRIIRRSNKTIKFDYRPNAGIYLDKFKTVRIDSCLIIESDGLQMSQAISLLSQHELKPVFEAQGQNLIVKNATIFLTESVNYILNDINKAASILGI